MARPEVRHLNLAFFRLGLSLLVAVAGSLAGCGERVLRPQPVGPRPWATPSPRSSPLPDQAQPSSPSRQSRGTGLETIPDVPAPSVLDLPRPSEQATYHEVESGETLSGIARRYGVSQQRLLKANGLDRSATLYPGQLIYIPGLSS